MAWTAPRTWGASEVVTADLLNEQIRDNLMETMPAKAQTSGGYFVTESENSIIERTCDSARVDRYEKTTSGSYTNLATVGPEVTLETGSRALVWIATRMQNEGFADAISAMSFGVSGATTIAPSDTWCVKQDGVPINNAWAVGMMTNCTTLVPGTNTFTAKYRGGGAGRAAFSYRFIAVFPY
jgi:hypothetical protein